MTSVSPASTNHSLKRVLAVWLLVPLVVLVPVAATLQYWVTLQPALQVLDLLFGKEEEFEYTSTTAPGTPPAA